MATSMLAGAALQFSPLFFCMVHLPPRSVYLISELAGIEHRLFRALQQLQLCFKWPVWPTDGDSPLERERGVFWYGNNRDLCEGPYIKNVRQEG